MTTIHHLALLAALILAGGVMTAFCILYAKRSPWWKHERGGKRVPNIMGRALMALGVGWAAELDTTVLVQLVRPGPWVFWVAIVIHLFVAAAGANLLWLLYHPKEGSP